MTPEAILTGNIRLAAFMGKEHDIMICDNCRKSNPEVFSHQPGLTICCSTHRIGTDEKGLPIWDNPKKAFYDVDDQHSSIGKAWPIKLKADGLLYHQSWDWLMPVVQRIDALGYQVQINSTRENFIYKKGTLDNIVAHMQRGEDFISSIWVMVADFVKWYNESGEEYES